MFSALCEGRIRLSPNYNYPRNRKLSRVTVHCYCGNVTAESMGEWFSRKSTMASCNYGVDKDGRVIGIVDEDNRSWCSSSSDNDNRAITIEVASSAYAPYSVTPDALDGLLNLLVDICKRYNKTKLVWIADKTKALSYVPEDDELLMTVHRWFANKACPGEYLLDKHTFIAEEVTRRLKYENVKERPKVIYNTVEEMPEAYRPSVQKLLDRGVIKGTAAGLDISREMARMIVILDRAGVFDR